MTQNPPAIASLPAALSSPEEKAGKRLARGHWIALFITLAVLVAGGAYFLAHRGLENTNDAQIDADVVSVSTRASGTVAAVHFRENQRVKAGTLLVSLDDAEAKARLAQREADLQVALASAEAADADAAAAQINALGNRNVAAATLRTSSVGAEATSDQIREGEAQVAAAQANLEHATLQLSRQQALQDSGASAQALLDAANTAQRLATTTLAAAQARLATLRLSQSQAKSRVAEASAKLEQTSHVDVVVRQAEARAHAAHAQVETARAARDVAALSLSYMRIYAPTDGVVSKKAVNEGQTVNLGQPVVQLVPDARWITANFKETQLADMRVGAPAKVEIDAYPGVKLHGEVQSFSGATGARFTLLPPDNASGNFTKVVQRVPVRIRVYDVPKGLVLRPGMSVDATVDTKKHG